MKMRTIAKKSMVAILMCGSIVAVRPAKAFVWPVLDVTQVGSFVTNINTGISEVTNTKSQIENAVETVNSVGDQATAISKYSADLTGTGAKVGDIDLSVMTTDKDIKKVTNNTLKDTEKTQKSNEELADVTIKNINLQIDNNATPEEIQETITTAKEESQAQTQELNLSYDTAEKEITNIADNVIGQLKGVVIYLDENTDIEKNERLNYKKEAENLIKQTENLKKTAQEMLAAARIELNSTYAANIAKSFDEYAQSAEDFQAGRIDEESFRQAGERLKQDISSNNIGVTSEDITHLITSSQQIVDASKKLQENILNSQSNSREYSDDEPEKISFNLNIKYDFQYSSDHQGTYAKEIYFNEDLDEEYQTFILSQELLCHSLKEKNLEELEKHTAEFSECLTLAKTEKDYICSLKGIDEESEKCDPYQLEPNGLYLPYKKNGVYDHIIEDYSVVNIQDNARNQQYADSWMRGDESVYDEFIKQIEGAKIDTTRNGYEFMGLIDLEGPKLWNKIRVVDTVHRSKKAVQRFAGEKSIYLDKRDENFVNAYKKKPGIMKVDTLAGDAREEQQIFSNVFLHHCDIKAEDISVSLKEKYTDKTAEAEKKIVDCMFKYAVAASARPKKEKETYCGDDFTVQQCAEQWVKNEKQAINDSAFQTITLATINNYKSSQDYAEKPKSKTNIITLADTAKEAKTSRDGYAAGAQINYYETMQILGIVDADAQNLQTEILALLPEVDYNFFDDSFGKDEGEQK